MTTTTTATTTTTQTVPRPADHVRTLIEDGTAVLLDMRRGRYLGLDEVATRIWRLLEAGTAEHEIVRSLVDAYGADPETVRSDLAAFLAQCRRRELLAPA